MDSSLCCFPALWIVAIYFDRDIVKCQLFRSARFVVPNCCIGLTQFLFDVLISVYWLCFLGIDKFNPLNPELNPICYLLALLGAHHFFHVSRIRVKLLTLRLLMSYIYIYVYIYICVYIYIWNTYS